MKQKVFIIFILISLISLLLIACGQNGKKPDDPVDNADAQRRSEQEEAERRERIEIIKNATSSYVKKVLGYHNDANWNGEIADFTHIISVFSRVPHRVANDGTEFLYYDLMDDNRAKESKAERREVYLALGYDNDFIWVLGGFASKLIGTVDLLTKNKDKLKDFFIKIRNAAKAYYIDVYDTLEKKLDNLESLSAAELKSLSIKLGEVKTARVKLIVRVVRPLRNEYLITRRYLSDPNAIIPVNITADEVLEYWNTLSAEFDSICNEIIRLGGEIKEILTRAN
ncbi:virulence associated lipoprotein (plasmid) [Borrelia recurrentis]|uniref:virulence associated lipoprotein n=1 Tax=Borrelia recurrentis TaxID=44449 RepID=UPI00366E32FF